MSLVFDNKLLKLSRSQLPQCASRLDWQRHRLDYYKLTRLRSILLYSKQHSPWYKNKLANLDVNNITLDQMDQIPILTKSDLMAHWNDIVTDDSITLSSIRNTLHEGNIAKPTESKYQVVCSGGTSGAPGIFIYDKAAWINCFNSTVRTFNRDFFIRSSSTQEKLCRITIAAPFSNHMTSNLTQHNGNHIYDLYLPVTLPYQKILSELNTVLPDILQGYPSILLKLAQSQHEKKINLQPKIIVTMGEPLYQETASIIKATWDAKIYNVWACGEFGPLAITCNECDNLIGNTDHCMIELVDANNNHMVDEGTISDAVLITGLHNKLMPLIRYRIDDQVILSKSNSCCGELDVFGGIMGRTADTFIYGEIVVHSYCFRSLLHLHPEIINYQIVQTMNGICLKLEQQLQSCHDIILQLQKSFITRLTELGIRNPDVKIVFDKEFQKTPAGKIQRFIGLR